jgi:hypothetical protein
MPRNIGTGGTRGMLWHGATSFGGTWSFGTQRAGFPFKGDQSPSFTACPSAWSVGRAGGAGGLAAWVSARGFPGLAPSCARRSLGEGSQPDLPYLQLQASLRPCSPDLSVL